MGRPSPSRILRQVLITGLGAALLALLPWQLGLLDRWEAKTWDMRASWLAKPGTATGDIVLILLDQQSLDWGREQSGLSWPWPREVYGVLLDFCRRAQAASLAVDVLFLEPSAYGVEDDRALALALLEFPGTALAVFLSHTAAAGGSEAWPADVPDTHLAMLDPFRQEGQLPPGPTAVRASLPVPELARSAAILGNVQLRPDKDGVFRRLRPVEIFDGRVIPALALAGYLASAGQERHAPLAPWTISPRAALPKGRGPSLWTATGGPCCASGAPLEPTRLTARPLFCSRNCVCGKA